MANKTYRALSSVVQTQDRRRLWKKFAIASFTFVGSCATAFFTSKGMPGEEWNTHLSMPILVFSSIAAVAMAIWGVRLMMPPPD